MTTKNRGLGRGLDALLGGGARKEASDQEEKGERPVPDKGMVSQLGIELIQRGRYQPRRHFDEEKLQELADSISAQGVVQPIVVRPVGNVYEIIAGERRWRAAQLAGLHEIPAVVRDVDDQAAMAMALIENIQRDDLNPLEEAGALHRLLEEFGLTHQEIATAVGKSRTTVTNLLRLLELEPEVKAWLDEGKMEMGQPAQFSASPVKPRSKPPNRSSGTASPFARRKNSSAVCRARSQNRPKRRHPSIPTSVHSNRISVTNSGRVCISSRATRERESLSSATTRWMSLRASLSIFTETPCLPGDLIFRNAEPVMNGRQTGKF